MATNRKHYEEKGFEFEFTPGDGGPYQGILVVKAPEIEDTYTAELSLSKPRSCNEYASRAVEVCGMSKQALQAALNALCSRRYEEVTAAETAQEEHDSAEEHPEVSEEEITELIGKPRVLDRFVRDAARISGVVGEQNVLRLIALGALSAQLGLLPNGKPIGANIVLIGEPGRGKNFACDAITRLLPEEFCLAFESSSAKSLYYLAAEDPTCLKHRVLYANEAEAIDLLVETVRPLLSGATARHLTVASDTSGRNVGQEFVIEGPATVIVCTVRNKLEGQLQSRLLVSGLEDFEGRVAAHSEAVSGLLSSGYTGTDYSQNIRAWTAALRSLTGVRRVVVPVEHPQFRFDSDVVSHGARLWTNFLGLMCTNAWLEQQNRKLIHLPNGETAVVATASDYALAYEVFGKTCERSIINLSEAHRKILNAIYDLQEELRGRKELDHFSGFTQRKIAQRAGVAQSTVSANRTFLVKSVKLLRETSEGGLRLVDEAEPSWWSEDNTLDGFPKPEQVREWWGGDDSLPSGPDSADQTDQDSEDAPGSSRKAVEGDWPPADQVSAVDDHAPEALANPRGDRREDAYDREGPDWENGSSKTNEPHSDEVIGTIGDLGATAKKPNRAAELEKVLRRHGDENPGHLYTWYRSFDQLAETGVFDGLGFVPEEDEVDRIRWKILQGDKPYPRDEARRYSTAAPWYSLPPIDDVGLPACYEKLGCLLGKPTYAAERDPQVFIDAVVVLFWPYAYFVPSREEMEEAMRLRGLEPVSQFSPGSNPGHPSPPQPLSEVERAVRRAQREPKPGGPPWHHGSLNVVQESIRHGETVKGHDAESISRTCSYLQRKGYLDFRPSEAEVKELVIKLAKEITDAEARHYERVKSGYEPLR